LADVFEGADSMPGDALAGVEAARAALWELVEGTPWLVWMFLTKRPENVMGMVPERWRGGLPGNVWVGTSVEDQVTADVRIPELLLVPAGVLFLSCEPLLGEVSLEDLVRYKGARRMSCLSPHGFYGRRIDWVIAGGESGPGARPVHPNWVRLLRDDCHLNHVPFFFKQWGEFDEDGKRVGKKASGRLLDGETWDQLPGDCPEVVG
jgi:protein gp37